MWLTRLAKVKELDTSRNGSEKITDDLEMWFVFFSTFIVYEMFNYRGHQLGRKQNNNNNAVKKQTRLNWKFKKRKMKNTLLERMLMKRSSKIFIIEFIFNWRFSLRSSERIH